VFVDSNESYSISYRVADKEIHVGTAIEVVEYHVLSATSQEQLAGVYARN
jgi:hypothetical protein